MYVHGEVELTGRNLVEDIVFNALAITDTAAKFGTWIDSFKYKSMQFLASTSLNQPVTVKIQIKSPLITSGLLQSLSGATFSEKTITIPATGGKFTFNLNDLGIDTSKGMPYQTLFVVSCATAPTAGSLSLVSWGGPN